MVSAAVAWAWTADAEAKTATVAVIDRKLMNNLFSIRKNLQKLGNFDAVILAAVGRLTRGLTWLCPKSTV